MQNLVQLVFGFVGGLGLFLYGMLSISEALRKVAGERLKKILGLLTRTPVIGVAVGTVVTVMVQSSSVTTVMLVGFVNAGLLSLRQAIGAVMGANIGTTSTAWLVAAALKFSVVENLALASLGVGFAMMFIPRNRGRKAWGHVLLSFGLIILGIKTMSEPAGFLKQSEAVAGVFARFAASPVLGVLVGTLFTMVLQSSSATISIMQGLAITGLIPPQATLGILLGDNIGTTITANIAAVGAGVNAKRTARAHFLFNALGVAYMLPLLYVGLGSPEGSLYHRAVSHILSFMHVGPAVDNVPFYIAAAHSGFNIFNTVVFLGLLRVLERGAVLMVPGTQELTEAEPHYLEERLLETPALALAQAVREVSRMGKIAREALSCGMEGLLSEGGPDAEAFARKEEVVDSLQSQITQYLVELSQHNLSEDESERLPVLIHMVNDLERVSDHGENLVELGERLHGQRLPLTDDAMAELSGMWDAVRSMFDEVLEALDGADGGLARRALKREDALNRMTLELRGNHIARLCEGKCNVLSGVIFLDAVANLEKVGDHLTNVAEAIEAGMTWHAYR